MKKKKWMRLMGACLLLALCLTAVACTTPTSDENGDTVPDTSSPAETQAPFDGLQVDHTFQIQVPADADEIIRKAADRMTSVLREKAGLSLSVVTEAGGDVIALGTNVTDSATAYAVSLNGRNLRIDAKDSITLYYAVEAVLDAWLTSDFGLVAEGQVSLPADRVPELNGLTTRRDNAIKVLSQNMRYTDDPNGNTIQLRSQRFMEMLAEYNPDLFGAQEYTYGWSVWLQKHTKKAGGTGTLGGYSMVGCSRDGRDTTGGEFNPIFYRTDRFELLDSDTFWLSDTPEVVSKVEHSSNNRICTWALLKDKQTGETILFANTHLDHTTDDIRAIQVEYLMSFLARHVGEYPLYLTGDFNCTSDSVPYATVSARLANSHQTAWIDHSVVENTYHDYTVEGMSEIDFIFHNDKTTAVQYEIISKQYDGFVSDHYGVIAEFVNE